MTDFQIGERIVMKGMPEGFEHYEGLEGEFTGYENDIRADSNVRLCWVLLDKQPDDGFAGINERLGQFPTYEDEIEKLEIE